MKNKEITKQRVETTAHETVSIDIELCRVGAVVTSSFAGAIGLWAVVSFSSALIAEGPLNLFISLVGAISGTI